MRRIGDISSAIVRDLRFQRNVEHLHSLGPRAVGEFLAEIGADRSIQTLIEQKLESYAKITLEQAEEVVGNDWPSPVLRVVGEGE